MGYAVYRDPDFPDFRWAGYGVPAPCDLPDCTEKIDRGLAYKCKEHAEFQFDPETEEEFEVIEEGCNLYFCEDHLYETEKHKDVTPKPDSEEWERFMLTDESWDRWRQENPETTKEMQARWL